MGTGACLPGRLGIKHGVAASLIAAMLFAPGLTWAQVDEIVVSVRKKSESLQDVPMAVTAFGAEAIDRKGIRNVADVAKFTSSIQFDESFAQSDTRIVVRGLSPTRGRQNVALLVDGIDVSSEAITSSGGSLLVNTRLIDIERIEVVLGPQMALYGRSAFNGALQYITKDPSAEFEAELKGEVNEKNGYELTGSMSGPIIGDTVGFRLNATAWEQEGFYSNSVTGKKIGGDQGYGLALSLKSAITENFGLKFRAEYTNDESQPSAQVYLPFNTELTTPASAFAAGVASCNQPLIDALSDWNDPNNADQGVAGNNQAWLDRAQRVTDPAYLATLDPDTLDPTSQNFRIPGGGSYCNETLLARVGQIPGADQLNVAVSPNPSTPGIDYTGFDRELVRFSLVADWTNENYTFTSLTGFTWDDNTEQQDTNAFAVPAPSSPFLDENVNTFTFDNAKTTEQFSQDFLLVTTLDGPVNGSIGALYWTEDVDNSSQSITAQGSGSHCFWNSATGAFVDVGEDSCTGYTDTPIAPYQAGAQPFRRPSPANRETDHWSIHGNISFDLAERWTLNLEGRYNDEDVVVEGPIFFDPGASGGPGGLNPCGIFFRSCEPFADFIGGGEYYADSYFPWTDEDANEVDLGQFVPDQLLIDQIPIKCWQQNQQAIINSIEQSPATIEYTGTPSQITGPNGETINVRTPAYDANAGDVIVVQDGNGQAVPNPGGLDYFNPWCNDTLTKSDKWFSPKAILEWRATDDILVYGSWSRARKPGGFSLLTVGASGLDRELTEFEAEKMVVWEVGGNTAWLDSTLIVNGSFFFQDFTDKQALTSAPGNDGRLVSKIENAGAAEVWGAELRVEWSPIAEFLGGNWRLSGSYTWLDAEYTDFTVETGSPITAATAGNCEPTLVGVEILCTVSYTGNKLEDAPEGAFTGQAGYYFNASSTLTAYVEVDTIWQDKRYAGITNNSWTDAYWLANLRLGVQSDNWDVVLFVDNALDDDTVQFSGGGPGLGCCFALGSEIDAATDAATVMVDLPPFSTAFLPRPRVVGMRASFRFGAR